MPDQGRRCPRGKVDTGLRLRGASRRDSLATKLVNERRSAELLFQVLTERREKNSLTILTERSEKNSLTIASTESFGGWTKTFTDPRLCAAVADRLALGGNIIETGTESYRLAGTRAAQAQAQDAAAN